MIVQSDCGKVCISSYRMRLEVKKPFVFLNHVSIWDVSKLYYWQVEHPLLSRLQLRIPSLNTMVYVAYCLFSSYGIPTSVGKVL